MAVTQPEELSTIITRIKPQTNGSVLAPLLSELGTICSAVKGLPFPLSLKYATKNEKREISMLSY